MDRSATVFVNVFGHSASEDFRWPIPCFANSLAL